MAFPRNLNQAKVLDESLDNISLKPDNAILFDVDFKILQRKNRKKNF